MLVGESALRPTIGQVGHMNFIHPFRVQILGAAELAYLRALPEDELNRSINRLFTTELAAIVVANGEQVPRHLLDMCNQHHVALRDVAAAVAAHRRRLPHLPVARARANRRRCTACSSTCSRSAC